MLRLEHISKIYEQDGVSVPALQDVSLSIAEGEYVAVMGPSGSGKTTLMNIIGCLDMPTSGNYQFHGVSLTDFDDVKLSRLRNRSIGFVFQNFNLLPKQSAADNVMLPLYYMGVPRKERQERALQALSKVGLADRVTFRPTQLSGGQKQRVAIARAIVTEPDLLLADEPTGALDSASGKQIMELFSRLNEEGKTILMITHDRAVAEHAARIMWMKDGRLYDGAPGDGVSDSGRSLEEEKVMGHEEHSEI